MADAPQTLSPSAGAAVRPSVPSRGEPSDRQHVVQFYDDDAFMLERAREFLSVGLQRGESVIVVLTPSHLAGLNALLMAEGFDLDVLRITGRYVDLDAQETMQALLVNGAPDPERFERLAGELLNRALACGQGLRVFGEGVALLASSGNYAAAVALERLWNHPPVDVPFAVLCVYPMSLFGAEALAGALNDVCGEHTAVLPTEQYVRLQDTDARLRKVAWLEQQAQALAVEVVERQRAERALQALLRASQKLHASLDLDSLLDQLVEEALELADAEGGCAGLRTPEGMVCQAYQTRNERRPLAYCWPAGHGLPGWLLEHKRPYLTNDARNDPQIVPALRDAFGVWSAVSTPILDAQGEVLGFFELHNRVDGRPFSPADQANLIAIAQIASVAIQNARLYQQAQDAIRLRNELLSVAAHELRTPLTSVAAHAQLMLRRLARDAQVDAASVERAFRAISQQSGKLTRLVDQCLDVTRLESGRLQIHALPTDLRQVVDRVAEAIALRTTQPLLIEAPDALSAVVDPLRVDQMLSNLVENALRYGDPEAPIEISLALTSAGTIELSVRDYGPGIPPARRDGLFGRFYQAHADGYQSGMGLGLYLCQEIAHLHGGDIDAQFPDDGGLRMVIRLPAAGEATEHWAQTERTRLAHRGVVAAS